MKILILTDDFLPNVGGVSYTLFNLYKFLNKAGHETLVLNPFLKGKKLLKLLTLKYFDFKTIIFFFKNKKFTLFILSKIYRILTESKISKTIRLKLLLSFAFNPFKFIWIMKNSMKIIPYIQRIDPDLLVGSNSSWGLDLFFILSLSISKKFLIMTYGKDFLSDPPLYIKRFYFTQFDKILVISNHMKRLFKHIYHLNDSKLEIANVGVDVKKLEIKDSKMELRYKYKISGDTYVVLSVGRHNPRKGFDLVIKSIKNIKGKNPNIDLKYILIGKGRDTNRLKSLTKKLNLENEIKFLGECRTTKKNEFYKLSDVFVMPSIPMKGNIEGFGIVFLEANYHKLPVIGTATGGIRDAIIHNKTGLLVKPNELEGLTKKIIYLYNNPEKRKILGECGHKRVLEKFSWRKLIMKYIKIFKKTLNLR